MIKALDCNTKRPFAKEFPNLITISDLIVDNDLVVTLCVIISTVVISGLVAFNLLAANAYIVDLGEVKNFLDFIGR